MRNHLAAAVVRERDVLDLEHADASRRGGVELHRRSSRRSASGGELLAKLHQGRDPAFVACSPRFDAATYPRLLLRELLRLSLPVDGLVGKKLGLSPDERRIVAFPAGQLTSVEIQYLGGDALQESPVVGDDQDRHLALTLYEALKPVYRLHVEVVGRLVEQQKVGPRKQSLLKYLAPAPSAGERIERIIPLAVVRNLLGNVDGLQVRRTDDLAAVRLEHAGDHLHQGGLPFAVSSSQRGAESL